MRRKNKVTMSLLFLSIGYMTLCCLIFFSLALVTVKFIISHKVNIGPSDIKHVLVTSVIAGVASGLGSWIFAKIDERKNQKTPHPDSE